MYKTLNESFTIDRIEYTPCHGRSERWAKGGAWIHKFDVSDEEGYLGRFALATNSPTRALVHASVMAHINSPETDIDNLHLYADPSRQIYVETVAPDEHE